MRSKGTAYVLVISTLLFFWLFLSLFVVDNGVQFGTIYPKSFHIVNALAFISIVFLLRLFFFSASTVDFYYNKVDFFILLYAAYLIFRYLQTGRPYFDELWVILLGLTACIIFKQVLLGRHGELIIKASSFILLFFTFFECIYAILQYANILGSLNDNFRMTGSFHNPGPLAIWCIAVAPISVAFLNDKRNRFLFVCILGIILAVIVLSFSRASWVALIASISYYFIRQRSSIISLSYFKRFKILLVILITSLIGLFGYGLIYLKPDSAFGRLAIWRTAGQLFLEKPMFGHGLHSFGMAFGQQMMEKSKENQYQSGNLLSEKIEYAFNDPLQILSEQGLLGFLLLFLMVSFAFEGKRVNRDITRRTIEVGLVSLLCASLFSYPLQLSVFWILLMYFIAALSSGQDQRKVEIHLGINLLRRSVCVTFIGCLICLLIAQYNIYSAKKVAFSANREFESGDINGSIQLYSKIYDLLKYDYSMSLPFAKALSVEKKFAESNDVIREAKKTISDSYMYLIEGDNYKSTGKYQLAERSYINACKLAPGLLYPKYLLMKMYFDVRDSLKTRKIAESIMNERVIITSPATEQMQLEALSIFLRISRQPENNK